MNRRKENGPLTAPQCKTLNHAWYQAKREGFPLNALLSIRPGNRTPLEHAQLVDKFWNKLGGWSRRHTPTGTFHAILTRETIPVDNFHALMHGNANLTRLQYALARWFPDGDVHVRRANYEVGMTSSGKHKSAFGYITKEREHWAAWGAGRAIPTVYARIFILLLRLHAKESARAYDPQTGEQEWAWWYMAEGGSWCYKSTPQASSVWIVPRRSISERPSRSIAQAITTSR
jgi:hypothetical protein